MLLNISGKKLRIKDCKYYHSLRGLMFDNMNDKDGALIHGNSIWMPFVKYDLDLFFLDKNFVVVDVQKAVPLTFNPKTWKTYRCEEAKYCLEIKYGVVKIRKGVKIIPSFLSEQH